MLKDEKGDSFKRTPIIGEKSSEDYIFKSKTFVTKNKQ